ncbi:MAG: beta-N-acetylhexosaminidase [Pirellulales bacterium]|nr:beta-N-acetylhexosaminidase [Pirellulales bacterium]
MRTTFLSALFVFAILGCVFTFSGHAAATQAPDSSFGLLLPAPQEIEMHFGRVELNQPLRLNLPKKWAESVGRYLWLLNDVLEARKAAPVALTDDSAAAAIRIVQQTAGNLPPDGYELKIGEGKIELTAADPAGAFNGLATLAQLIENCGSGAIQLSAGRIRDWPELATRAVHIDMTCQQYNAEYVQRLMRTLARYKTNAILMEYSGMFPFRKHKTIARPDAFSEAELHAILRTAEDCNQEIIPFMQCAAHLEYVLTQDPKAISLSKDHGGKGREGYSYCLSHPDTLPFAESLIDEILAQHPGVKRLHVGGDEVPKSRCERCAAAGDFSAMYLRHYARIADICRRRGVVPLMWTDMFAPFALQDSKEKSAELAEKIRAAMKILPRDVIGVDWWYGSADFKVSPKLRAAGFQAFTASAARCDSRELVDWPRLAYHLENIRGGCLQAIASKMPGTIITSWSYRGCPHELCLPEYAGISYAWNAREAGVPILLKNFFRQRYALPDGLSDALAQAALAETKIDVPTLQAEMTNWNAAERTWTIPPRRQAEQLLARIKKHGAESIRDSLSDGLRQYAENDALWRSVLQSAAMNRTELQCWDLSRRHLRHRLELTLALARMKAGEDVEQRLAALVQEGAKLREEWKTLYRDVFTPAHMKVELDLRFDAEPGIIDAVRRAEGKIAPPKAAS